MLMSSSWLVRYFEVVWWVLCMIFWVFCCLDLGMRLSVVLISCCCIIMIKIIQINVKINLVKKENKEFKKFLIIFVMVDCCWVSLFLVFWICFLEVILMFFMINCLALCCCLVSCFCILGQFLIRDCVCIIIMLFKIFKVKMKRKRESLILAYWGMFFFLAYEAKG